jgi:copper resistance protein B
MRKRAIWMLCAVSCAVAAEHVPPDPPTAALGPMSAREMSRMMEMDDTRSFGTVIIDQLEWRNADAGSAAAWDAEAWYGGDYNKLWLKTEGQSFDATGPQTGRRGSSLEASADLLWDRIISRWWNLQAGLRQDFGDGPGRTWGAFGIEGLAPFGVDAQATLYLGEEGRSALRVKAEYDLYLTQRLVVQPKIEANAYGRADPQRNVGTGLSNADLGLRLRYEFRREFAPYIGLDWSRAVGSTAGLIRDRGRDPDDLQVVAGLKIWF